VSTVIIPWNTIKLSHQESQLPSLKIFLSHSIVSNIYTWNKSISEKYTHEIQVSRIVTPSYAGSGSPAFLNCLALKGKELWSFEICETITHLTQNNNPEESKLQQNRRENPISLSISMLNIFYKFHRSKRSFKSMSVQMVNGKKKRICWDCGRDGETKCQWEVNSWSDSYWLLFPSAVENGPPGLVRARAIPIPSRAFELTLPALNSPPFLVSLCCNAESEEGRACLHMKAWHRHPNSTWRPEMGWEARVIWFRRQIQPTSTGLLIENKNVWFMVRLPL
jgi:hypothetical protein